MRYAVLIAAFLICLNTQGGVKADTDHSNSQLDKRLIAGKQNRPLPGTPRLNKTMYETQDLVITTHNALDYGVTPDDKRDDTSAFQKAIDACYADGGGVIFVPPGKYIFRDRVHLKSGVILRGEWRNPEKNNALPIGTLFCVYYGKNQPEGDPFILMSSSTGLKELAIWYPEQSFAKPALYATTIKQDAGLCASLENVTIYNAWKGIVLGPETNQFLTVKNLFMTALHIGFIRDQAYDCPRLHKVYMSPKYWIESGLDGSPVTKADQIVLKKFLLKESIGAMITHYDWVWMYDWHIEGFHTGIVTRPSLVKKDKPGPNGGWVKLRLKDNFIGMQLGNNNHQGWSSTDVHISSKLKNAIGIKTAADFGSISQFTNITFDGRFKYCVLTRGKKGRITFSGCNFKGWNNDGYAVCAEAGTIELIKSNFLQPGRHIKLGQDLVAAALISNSFSGSPDIINNAPKSADIVIDHNKLDIKLCDTSGFEFPEAIYKPENQTLYNVRDFGAKGDSIHDDSKAFQKALDTAAEKGGGTVYVPAGKYVLKTGIVVPEKIELRGVFDMTHHTSDSYVKRGIAGSELFALAGKGDENGTPLIRLKSGASLRGVSVYYPEQKWSDYVTNGEFTEFPWTIQSLGENVRVKDVTLANSYKGADFGTYDSTGHRIDFLCGTVLKTGLYVDKCFGKGYIKSTHWNPSFWAWSKYPDRQEDCDTLRDNLLDTLTGYVFGYTQEEHTLHMFSFGSKTGTKFINNPEYGGANGIFIGNGTDLSETSLCFEDIGTNAKFINFQIVSMGSKNRKRYLDIGENVKGRAEFYNLLMWGYDPGVDCGIEMKSGDFYFLQMNFRTPGQEYGIKQTGGKLTAIAPSFHLEPGDWLNKKPEVSGLYAYFGEGIIKADLIGTLIKNKHTDEQLFVNKAGDKCSISHSIHYQK